MKFVTKITKDVVHTSMEMFALLSWYLRQSYIFYLRLEVKFYSHGKHILVVVLDLMIVFKESEPEKKEQ